MPALVRTHLRNARRQLPSLRTGHRTPLAWTGIAAFERDAGGNRTHFDRVAAGCLAVWLQRQVSSSGVEPDPRPSQRRMHPPHPEDISAPPRNRTSSCSFEDCRAVRHTRRTFCLRIPTWSRTRTWTFGGSYAVHYTIGTFFCKKSRRLDSHQHEAVYGTAAFLYRATSAKSRSAPIRTVSSSFGDRLLAQEHTPVEGCPRGIEPAASTFTASHAIPLHHRHHQPVVPAGFEPAIFPMSRGCPVH
jgi:hypothetical protein